MKKGFTLAEVLITLVIIGVVAALTVPTLITKYQKEQTVTRLKKAYSALSQATQRAIADYGVVRTWTFPEPGNGLETWEFAKKYIYPYMNVSVDCGTNTGGTCEFSYWLLNESRKFTCDSRFVRFSLNDGTLIALRVYNHNTVSVYIDINGKKKPNKLGRDVFSYLFSYNKGFTPNTNNTSRESLLGSGQYTCNLVATGEYCAAVIMKDGWRIADDYPW